MENEFTFVQEQQPGMLVPRPLKRNIITGKWVFQHKTRADGTLERYKARWVVRGFTQRPGIDLLRHLAWSSNLHPSCNARIFILFKLLYQSLA
jgi:hypothetical protein